jgi:type I restriction enzyme R subunit
MTTQPEQILEDNLVKQLIGMAYDPVAVRDEASLLANLKAQIEAHNSVVLSAGDFRQILNRLNKGSIFEKAKTLRDRIAYVNDRGETKTVELIDQIDWCKNRFQVTQQVTVEGRFKNRYDVTILMNGLPLVQIELKRRGLEPKEAFNQTNRYERHSYGAGEGLFQYIQVFVISNGVNTKYYSNNRVDQRSFKQTFYWTDKKNKPVTQLSVFAEQFLEKCHLAKMVTRFLVLNESKKMLMVLRPYQVYATEAIIEKVQHGRGYGYIWHTTGSGKTLTSFKTSQILTTYPKVDKVVFVVDRKDLDYQTTKEFNSFCKGSIDGTNNTKTLVKQFTDDTKLIVTTIQKLNTAIKKVRFSAAMEPLKTKRVVFIFDECHRSQFGETHQAIKEFFTKCQLFGFTGTPIFADNAMSTDGVKQTTKSLFETQLHSYVITDAIRDENVLKFSVEYMRTFKKKNGEVTDIKVEAIDEEEVFCEPERISLITEYIAANHDRKTHSRKFNAIFCVSGIPALIQYYQQFDALSKAGGHDLKIATIFSYQANEEDQDAAFPMRDDEVDLHVLEESDCEYRTKHSRDHLEAFIGDYNRLFGTNYTTKDTQSFYNYYTDVSKRMKAGQIDVLLVVNMFLTGFDSEKLNTLYADKNLKYHGLIQAFSRTNRTCGELKSQGNIVCFRNLKKATDKAIELFANKNAREEIVLNPYDTYVKEFNEAFVQLIQIAPSVNSVTQLADEEDELKFVKTFRNLIRLLNVLRTFTEFTFADLSMPEQTFEDYKSKYLDLHDKVKLACEKEKVSILNDIDFELELIHRDEINVAYILKLLAALKESPVSEHAGRKKSILDLLSSEAELRSKRELLEQFIEKHLPQIDDPADIPEAFNAFWEEEQKAAFKHLAEEEGLEFDKLEKLVGDYLFTSKKPLRNDVVDAMVKKPGLKERAPTAERIVDKIFRFIETFLSGAISG